MKEQLSYSELLEMMKQLVITAFEMGYEARDEFNSKEEAFDDFKQRTSAVIDRYSN